MGLFRAGPRCDKTTFWERVGVEAPVRGAERQLSHVLNCGNIAEDLRGARDASQGAEDLRGSA